MDSTTNPDKKRISTLYWKTVDSFRLREAARFRGHVKDLLQDLNLVVQESDCHFMATDFTERSVNDRVYHNTGDSVGGHSDSGG